MIVSFLLLTEPQHEVLVEQAVELFQRQHAPAIPGSLEFPHGALERDFVIIVGPHHPGENGHANAPVFPKFREETSGFLLYI